MTCGQETLSKSCRVNSLAIWNYDTSFVPLMLVKQNMKMRNAHCRKFTKKHALIYHDKPGVSGFVMPCRLPWQSWLADDKLNLEGEIKSRPGPFPMTGILSLLFVTNCSLCAAIPPSLMPPPLTVQLRAQALPSCLVTSSQTTDTDCDYQDWKGQFMSRKMHWVGCWSSLLFSIFNLCEMSSIWF